MEVPAGKRWRFAEGLPQSHLRGDRGPHTLVGRSSLRPAGPRSPTRPSTGSPRRRPHHAPRAVRPHRATASWAASDPYAAPRLSVAAPG